MYSMHAWNKLQRSMAGTPAETSFDFAPTREQIKAYAVAGEVPVGSTDNNRSSNTMANPEDSSWQANPGLVQQTIKYCAVT